MQSRYSKPVPTGNQAKYGIPKTKAYGRQPATALVFDLGSGISRETVSNVCDTLENVFSLACTLGGPCRIPFVSVMVLTTFHEVLLPMVGVRGNFTRIQSCLKELCEMAENTAEIFSTAREEGVSQALIEVCMQFQHQWQGNNFQSSAHQCMLQVFFITNKKNKNFPEVMKMVEKASTTVNVDHLKRIQVVGLCCFAEIMTGEGSNSLSSSSNESGSSAIEASMVEMVTIESDPLSLQMFFSSLFKDSGSDNEHLHLLLPAPSDGSPPLTVKCDLFERLISPSQLPFQQQFLLHSEGANEKPLVQPVNKFSGVALPLLKIRIRQILASSRLCESLVFGMPYIVEPTSSWKIDWDELERNRKNFEALCHLLLQEKNVLIGCLEAQETEPSTIPAPRKTNAKFSKVEEPHGYFVFLPCQNGTMLIKSLACKELMLHYNQDSSTEIPSYESLQTVEDSLSKVPQSETFNPLMEASGLYASLKKLVTHHSQSGLPKRMPKAPAVESTRVKQKPLFGLPKETDRKRSPAPSSQSRKARYLPAHCSDWVDDADFFTEME